MSKETVFTDRVRAEFMAEAEASHRPASQIMSEFVQRQRKASEYEEFLRGKVASAREQIRADDLEARFAAWRAKLLARACRTGA